MSVEAPPFVVTHECTSCGTQTGRSDVRCCGEFVSALAVPIVAEALQGESESARRYREFREEQKAERERVQAEVFDRLYSCWSCGCSAGVRCADHGGPCLPGDVQSLQGGKNERNPAGASLVAMAAIRRSFPDQAGDIIASLRWHPLEIMWSFSRWGHFVGVELDGEIHS